MLLHRGQPSIRGFLLIISAMVVLLTALLILVTEPTGSTLVWGFVGVTVATVGSVGLSITAMSIRRWVDRRIARSREEEARLAAAMRVRRRERVARPVWRELVQLEREAVPRLAELGRELQELLKQVSPEWLVESVPAGLTRVEQYQPERELLKQEALERLKDLERLVQLERETLEQFEREGLTQREQLERLEKLELVLWTWLGRLELSLAELPERREQLQVVRRATFERLNLLNKLREVQQAWLELELRERE
jgi:hypothetical protein